MAYYLVCTSFVQLLKKNSAVDGDMDEYRKNLRGHRLRITGLWAGVFAIIVIGALGIRSYLTGITGAYYFQNICMDHK